MAVEPVLVQAGDPPKCINRLHDFPHPLVEPGIALGGALLALGCLPL